VMGWITRPRRKTTCSIAPDGNVRKKVKRFGSF
jgi:hypothetical protein